jgi:Tol biopolymer transport system component
MALTAGSQLGPYEIQSAVAEGGTGEVYRARDTRLDRTVAIRLLPADWSDPSLKQRFEAEAKIVAGIQHPHIRTLHDIGRQPATDSAPDIDFLVLEHLEGETVAARLARAAGSSASKKKAAFSVDEVLAVAMQIAGALDQAHQKGLVHRGVKPATVFLSRGGKSTDPPIAKLLDLGLIEPGGAVTPGSSVQETLLPTREHATAQSAIVSSVEYLAPEQIEGKQGDARTDLFGLGVVLYEMLTARKAFEGKSRSALMAAIMTAEPDPLASAQPLASPALDHVIKRCLAKDPEDRWQTAHDLLIQLRWIAGTDTTSGPASVKERRRQWLTRVALAAAVVMIAALSAPLVAYLRGPVAQEPFQFRSPVVGLNVADRVSISPDGRLLAFKARPDTQQPASLYVRPVGGLASRKLAGTDDAAQPFWSPDSRYIGFEANGKLKKIEAVGGPAQDIAEAQGFAGGTWSEAGTIVFGSPKGLFSVSAEGGMPPTPLTTIDKAETGHFWPEFLPDGRHYLYQAWSGEATNRAIFIGSLDSKDRTKLMAAETNVAFARSTGSGRAPGYLVFHREATVFAQPFDVESLSFTGDAIQIAGGVAYDPASGRGNFDVSQGDVLVYFQGAAGGGRGPAGRAQTAANMQLGWLGRSGQLLAGVGDPAQQGDFDVSPDGSLVAVTRQDESGADVWVIDWQRAGNAARLTLDPADDINPVWSHDGSRVAFTSYRKGNADIYVKNANGVGAEEPLLESPGNEIVEAWSRDGRYIAYLSGQDNRLDIYALPLVGDKKPIPVVTGPYQKNEPQFSYDGKWLAYASDESGTFEVYVVSFPPKDAASDQKLKVSRDGGGQPRWRGDGKELYYRALDNRIMVVDFAAGAKIAAGVPQGLIQPIVNNGMTQNPTRHQLAASPDGQRFLIRVPPAQVQRGAEGGAPVAGVAFDPSTGQAFAGRGRAFGRGRGGGGAAGLTVIRNWQELGTKQ